MGRFINATGMALMFFKIFLTDFKVLPELHQSEAIKHT